METNNLHVAFADAPIDIIDGDRGKNYPGQQEFKREGFCLFLNAGNVTKNGFDLSSCVFVSEARDKALRNGKLVRNDIILTTRGTVGNVAIFNSSVPYEHVRINSGMVIIRANASIIDPGFLYCFLRSPLFIDQMKGLTTGSAQPQLPIRDINRIKLIIPPFAEQRAIATILGSLDDKIELNQNMCRSLEAISYALFRSWFVDFEPTTAMSKGIKTRLDPDIEAIFPVSLRDGIPDGWSKGVVSDVFRITMGQSPPGATYNQNSNGMPFYQGRADFRFRFPQRRVFCTQPLRIAEAGDALLSVRAPVGDVNVATERCALGRGVASLRHQSGSSSFTYYSLKSLDSKLARFNAEGTVFGAINKASLESLPVTLPPGVLISMFDTIVGPLDERILLAEKERIVLLSLREELLSQLLSGKIAIPESVKIIGRVA